MEQYLSIDDPRSASQRPPPAEQEAVWMQERLTLRLTKARREALLAIATIEGRAVPPVEAIDRAIALASRFLRGPDARHTGTAASREFSTPTHAMSNMMSDIPNPSDAMSDVASDTESFFDDRVPDNVRHLADIAGTGRNMTDNEPPPLAPWLTLEMERRGTPAAKTAVLLARRIPCSSGGGSDSGRLQCRLVAIDDHRIDGLGAVDVADWPKYKGVVSLTPAQTKAATPFLVIDGPHFLWAERQEDGGWLVHLHSISGTGVGSALAVFSMSDTLV